MVQPPGLQGHNWNVRNEELHKAALNKGLDPGSLAAGAIDSVDVFSGADCKVIFMLSAGEKMTKPIFSVGRKDVQELQTITITSASSVMPVRRVGELKPISYGRGGRTFAGTMVFTVINKDPFMELFAVDGSSPSTSEYQWHVDQIPPFDAMIIAQNESGGTGIQVIHGIRLVNWGTTYSVDDMYIESTYTYVAEHVSPFAYDTFDANVLFGVLQKVYGRIRDKDGEVKAKEKLLAYAQKVKSLYGTYSDAAVPTKYNIDTVTPEASNANPLTTDNNLGEFGLFNTDDIVDIPERLAKYIAMFENVHANFAIDIVDYKRLFTHPSYLDWAGWGEGKFGQHYGWRPFN